jgi:hypothetical protein
MQITDVQMFRSICTFCFWQYFLIIIYLVFINRPQYALRYIHIFNYIDYRMQ